MTADQIKTGHCNDLRRGFIPAQRQGIVRGQDVWISWSKSRVLVREQPLATTQISTPDEVDVRTSTSAVCPSNVTPVMTAVGSAGVTPRATRQSDQFLAVDSSVVLDVELSAIAVVGTGSGTAVLVGTGGGTAAFSAELTGPTTDPLDRATADPLMMSTASGRADVVTWVEAVPAASESDASGESGAV